MNQLPETVLHESLELLEQGQSIEQILAQYPEAAAELRPFLETAAQVATLAPQPSLAAKQKSQKAFLAHAKSLKTTPVRPSPWYRLRQMLLPIASLAVVLILFATTAVSVSGSAIPGDPLYSVKRLVENVRLNQANDPETAVALVDQYRQERIREVQTLLRTGRVAEATFEGEVEAIQPAEWLVAAIEVRLDDSAIVEGDPQIGQLARVNGRTDNGMFIAAKIEMLTGSSVTPEPEQEPVATAEPTPTIEPSMTPQPMSGPTETMTPTVTPTKEITATPTSSPTATVTPTATATSTVTPMPTQPPADDGGDDGGNNNGGNDNGNDNDDNDNNNDDDGNDNDDDGNDNDDDGNDNDDDGNDNDDDGNGNDNDDDGNDNDDDGNDNDDDDIDD